MADDELHFFYNCQNGSDKIWGYVLQHGEWIKFWGGRTKALAFQRFPEWHDMEKEAKAKKKRKYNEITFDELCEMNPAFADDFNHQFTMAILGDGYRNLKKDDNE